MPALPLLPQAATDYARAQRLEIQAAVAAIERQWRRIPPGVSWDRGWAIMATAQRRVAAGALAYIPAVLEETGQSDHYDADGYESPAPLIGVAGDGRPVDTLGYGAVVNAGTAYNNGSTAVQALQQGGQWLTSAMGTVLSDTGRSAESLAMGTRRVRTYVRMLVPPSCARCVLLAGRVTTAQTAFLRHRNCDCRNIPMAESMASNYAVDPHAYFQSLSSARQDEIFGAGDAEAIRNGADIFQVVNAHRGVRAAQIGGRKVLTTSEGMSGRGFARSRIDARHPRLMPETIRAIAGDDRETYLRLLRSNGYLL